MIPYPTAIPVVWALMAFSTAVLYLAFIFGLFFVWLYIVSKITLYVVQAIVRIMTVT